MQDTKPPRESDSVTPYTIPQIDEIFQSILHHTDTYLLAFIQLWSVATALQKAELYQAAQILLWRHPEITPHIPPEKPVSTQTLQESAAIVRGYMDDCVMNPEEHLALKRCIWAAETLGELEEKLSEVHR